MSTANLTDAEYREYTELMNQGFDVRNDKGDERLEYLIKKTSENASDEYPAACPCAAQD